MKDLRFDWDEEKNRINQKKHKVSFDEAATISPMRTAYSSTTRITQKRNAGSFSWGSVRVSGFSLYAIAIGRRMRSFGSFPLEEPTGLKEQCI